MGDLLAAMIECIVRAFIADQKLADESLFGDTPERRSSRRSCQWGYFLLLLLAIVIGVVLGGRG